MSDIAKDKGAFRTIGELSRELGIKAHILRYWEDQFAMLQPLKRAGARRHYRPEDVEMVKTINRLLNEEGYTIKGARKYLTSRKSRRPAEPAAIPMAPAVQEDSGLIVAELKNIRNRMSRALSEA
ncbi:DNA-binding transcriptional regulator, MerR family [Parasphingorhabdus marina DSM 22363]|uniref:DNA-binding transcriptional regulator, MerR family n=1 Tax=Parasphingorhabdus marina DSM 22363 TaxID=1123272 RepID=A0A1N6CTG4_9SPHN|nr:MerR family transcriptional regulator [Parasphingorhabdus marina]SIN61684.1 DNA-binding transcriptional regulator, MerR family [Parasphingorhabdus marina DSM 22363]